jgi:hypothetical protein
VSRAELLQKAAECEAKVSKLSTLADKLAKAYDMLDSIGPNLEQEMTADLRQIVAASRRRAWDGMRLVEAELKTLRAEQARLIEEAGGWHDSRSC